MHQIQDPDETPHGFDLTDEDRRLLRGPLPADALRWCEDAIGRGARAVRAEPLDGGLSSAVHAIDVEDRGRVHQLVLRRFVRADWLAEEPDIARREAAALQAVRACAIPTPELVAVDDEAVLMTRLDGSVVWEPADVEPFLRGLAGVLPEIHAVPVPEGVPEYSPYELETREPPAWSSRPEVWERAFEVFAGPAPTRERRFIHRDYHPGNVLWTNGAVRGVVDWVNASIGSPNADVGHCRMNLADELGIEAADRFLGLTERDDYHPYWDIVAALGGMEEWEPGDEDFVAQAVSRL